MLDLQKHLYLSQTWLLLQLWESPWSASLFQSYLQLSLLYWLYLSKVKSRISRGGLRRKVSSRVGNETTKYIVEVSAQFLLVMITPGRTAALQNRQYIAEGFVEGSRTSRYTLLTSVSFLSQGHLEFGVGFFSEPKLGRIFFYKTNTRINWISVSLYPDHWVLEGNRHAAENFWLCAISVIVRPGWFYKTQAKVGLCQVPLCINHTGARMVNYCAHVYILSKRRYTPCIPK